ncbi:hypothetical protein [Tenacibaculum aiptasiae]|uniref:hypothetical protein n=1 Tax=Tenacibaculum aiptasiae TaxID=426481 RepID=UPI003B5B81AA
MASKKIKFKEIDDKLLSEIISSRNLNANEQSIHTQKYHEYYSRNLHGGIQWDYNAYIRKIKGLINQNDLKDNFEFIQLVKAEVIEENGREYFVKYKICIKNLKILCASEGFSFKNLPISENYPINSTLVKHQYKGGVYLSFENNEFVRKPGFNGNPYINLGLSKYGKLNFFNNKFIDVDLYLNANYDDCYVNFSNNEFDNRHISLGAATEGDDTHGLKSSNWRLTNMVFGKLRASKTFERRINNDGFIKAREKFYEKIKDEKIEDIKNKDILEYLLELDSKLNINHNDVEFVYSNVVFSFRDNKINVINIVGKKLFFFGKNEINKMETTDSSEDLYFGPYNILDKEKNHVYHHKALFIALKEDAIKRKDKSQELIFNREVLRCEQSILKSEKKSFKWLFRDKSWKDRVLLNFNEKSNNFGLSWVRPIFKWMLISNLIFIIPFLLFHYDFSWSLSNAFNTVGMFVQFLLPTNTIEKVTGLNNVNKIWEAFNIIKNVFLAAFIFQALIAFRRFKNT